MTLFPLHFFIFYSKTPVHRLSLLFSQTELKLLRWDNKYLGAEFYSCAAKTVLFMIPCRKKETTNIKYCHVLGVFAYKKLFTRAKLDTCWPTKKYIHENFTNMPISKKIKHKVQNNILKAFMWQWHKSKL